MSFRPHKHWVFAETANEVCDAKEIYRKIALPKNPPKFKHYLGSLWAFWARFKNTFEAGGYPCAIIRRYELADRATFKGVGSD